MDILPGEVRGRGDVSLLYKAPKHQSTKAPKHQSTKAHAPRTAQEGPSAGRRLQLATPLCRLQLAWPWLSYVHVQQHVAAALGRGLYGRADATLQASLEIITN